MKISPFLGKKELLEEHIKEKAANQNWLYALLFSKNSNSSAHFPYALNKKGTAVLSSKRIETLKSSPITKTVIDPSEMVYWVTIPTSTQPRLYTEGEEISLHKKIYDQVKILTQEGFYEPGKTDAFSDAKTRLFVCFGLNQYKSIDQALNDAFIKVVGDFCPPQGLHVEAEGFLWKIPFTYTGGKKAPAHLDKPRKAFKKVKMLDPIKAELLRKEIEVTDQGKLQPTIVAKIPFCKIRNRVLKSEATARLTANLAQVAPENTHYFLTMDDDAISLKGEKGFFKCLDDTIIDYLAEGNNFPSLVTFGYSMPQNAGKLSKAATKIDMAVRSAMHTAFPLSCYMPEPGIAFFSGYCEDDLKNFIENATFEPHKPPSRDMESRRLIECLEQKDLLEPKNAIFKNVHALTTSEPPRMALVSQKQKDITPADLKKSSVQTQLRNIPQNHFTGRNFANNLYFVLPNKFKSFVGSVGALVVPVNKIFEVFDPLKLQKLLLDKKFFNAELEEEEAFDAAFALYPHYINAILNENNTPDSIPDYPYLNNNQIQEVFAHGRQSLTDARKAFKNYSNQHDVSWTSNEKARVEKTAQAACLAVYETLTDIIAKNSFD